MSKFLYATLFLGLTATAGMAAPSTTKEDLYKAVEQIKNDIANASGDVTSSKIPSDLAQLTKDLPDVSDTFINDQIKLLRADITGAIAKAKVREGCADCQSQKNCTAKCDLLDNFAGQLSTGIDRLTQIGFEVSNVRGALDAANTSAGTNWGAFAGDIANLQTTVTNSQAFDHLKTEIKKIHDQVKTACQQAHDQSIADLTNVCGSAAVQTMLK